MHAVFFFLESTSQQEAQETDTQRRQKGKPGKQGPWDGSGEQATNPNAKQPGTTKVTTSAAPQQGDAALKYPAI